MIIQSRRPRITSTKREQPAPVKKNAAPAPIMRESEKPQLKNQIETKAEVKPVVKTESQVEEKIEEIKVVKTPKKRSLLEEVLEEQAALED